MVWREVASCGGLSDCGLAAEASAKSAGVAAWRAEVCRESAYWRGGPLAAACRESARQETAWRGGAAAGRGLAWWGSGRWAARRRSNGVWIRLPGRGGP
ncbi:hypothetical protein GCM10010121_021730 [Streptomyces brasiliensis]|uniref:Uncharacterized protein n=1 Tax=Streptomyces brasiliensis TaxID=1954 RepID=A0A917NNH9_9ACTN|nr:hypothetical protein GCM10010121_021730 [Streptomyces brasiliensis]